MAGEYDFKIFYVLLIVLIVIGPTIYILNMANVGLGYWLDRFWTWGLDPYTVGGEALVTWWTMYDWAIWIAYAPLMGIFFAMIAYGRTIRQFLIINWILPASFWISMVCHLGRHSLKLADHRTGRYCICDPGRRSRSRNMGVPAAYTFGIYYHSRADRHPYRSFCNNC